MNEIDFHVYLNTLRQKGNLAYEYNPLHNYQTSKDLYIIDNKYILPYDQAINSKNGELLIYKNDHWTDKRGRVIDDSEVLTSNDGTLWAKAGSVIDLDTEKLNFSLDHPVEIEVQPSYDGSVNLILNDDRNIPRLINSRFSVREKNTYEIVDRIGENDTNIYNSETFDKDTSLYFQYEYNPIIDFLRYVKGTLPVGQYCFYFTYCDSDDNESDIIAETGLIPVFIGDDGDPNSMEGGIKNQSSNKGIRLKLTNIDKSYNYLKIYYVRYFADYGQNRVTECKKIIQKFPINSNILYIQISGEENTENIDPNILNFSKFNPKSVLTQAQCKNILFFGNIVKNTDNYKELSDLALRIIPSLHVNKYGIDSLNSKYGSNSFDCGYYNTKNIYNKTGYFNKEYYRFGVVFIYQNGTLSNVYNTLGGALGSENQLSLSGDLYTQTNDILLQRNYIKSDDNGWIKSGEGYSFNGKQVNSKGVCKIDYSEEYYDNTIFSVNFTIPKEVSKMLREELGIRGLFFVRQKCTPNIIAQCYLLRMDEVLEAPILEEGKDDTKKYYTECFVDKERNVTHDYDSRLYTFESNSGTKITNPTPCFAGICPDFLLNQPYFNQIFNGGKFKLQKISQNDSELIRAGRFYNEKLGTTYKDGETLHTATICTVTEDVPTVAIHDKIYKLEIGQTEESYKFKYVEVDNSTYNAGDNDFDKINNSTNIVRGKYSPYLAIYNEEGSELKTGCLYNIYKETLLDENQEYLNRGFSSEPFYAISNRFNIVNKKETYECFRGDCYTNQFTYRLNRNFNDPSLPNNETIIDPGTWQNYNAGNSDTWKDISRSDLNAVKMGSWITFRVRSAMNYALRSVDHSFVSEEALMGSPRSFYPKSQLLERGENKMPDSYLYNDAYRASLGFKQYYTLQDINYIKDSFSNRIQYSAVSIQDSFKNNYRDSYSTYFRDYSQEYGSIQKLVGFEGYLLVIFEHAIGVAVINERILAGQSDGEPVFINTNNVLPEELTIISDTYGTQWGDSVVKSEAGYVYGVDTEAKKIWRVKGQQLEILSDFKVNKFLIDNITLREHELYPTIGLKNVKTHYNNNKKDVMFTFYDDVYKGEEKAWNLCYNELLGEFVTFYSWIPSYSENIDTKFFSFDRNTSKYLSLLSKCNYNIPENTGVLIDSPVLDSIYSLEKGSLSKPTLHYTTVNKSQILSYTVVNDDGTTSQKTITKEGEEDKTAGQYVVPNVKFKIEKDCLGNYNLFKIEGNTLVRKEDYSQYELQKNFEKQKVIILFITPYLENVEDPTSGLTTQVEFPTEMIAITLNSIVQNSELTSGEKNRTGLTTDFYLHGNAGIFNVAENLYPTHWYGEFHPFEFEFVVNDKISLQKVFTDLVLISNKAEPESFHFEVEGDNYDFSSDKRTMYFRQEATKNLYQNLGSDITYDRKYTDVAANKLTQEQKYRSADNSDYTDQYRKMDRVYPVEQRGLVRQVKSSIFPLYYERVDTYNDIYHKYREMTGNGYDFKNLSGSEIKWDRDTNQFNVVTHIKNSPIDQYGILRGNSRYLEGKWNIQIPSIIFMQKNESKWVEPYERLKESGPTSQLELEEIPPIVINSQYIPKDLKSTNITLETLPNIYKDSYLQNTISLQEWTARKETRIRDKWMKVRVRYSGKNLAIIHSLATLYNISYS